MTFEGTASQTVVYDPNRHAPLQAGHSMDPGQVVTVRFPGISYRGKILYKAIVE